jgi:outer membrane protein TolC
MLSRIALLAALLSVPVLAEAGPERAAPALKRYTFEQALKRAVARNPTAATAEQEIIRAEALVREARAGSFPTLYGNAAGIRRNAEISRSENGSVQVVQPEQSLSANLTLTVPLVAPQRWAQWSHAKDGVEISKTGAADVKRLLALATGRAYLAVVAQQRTLEVTERAFRTAQAHYEFAHGRRVGGVGNRLDEVRAEQEEETTRTQAELSRAALAKAQEALGVLLAEDGPVDATAEVSLPEPPPIEVALATAPSLRTDVKALETRSAAASHLVRDSYVDYIPLLSAQFQPFYQNPSTFTQPEAGWTAQLVLSIPFYDGGFRYGARQERKALEAESRLAIEQALRQAQAEVRSAFESMQRADAALDSARRSAQLGHEALDLANKAYQAGATTNLDVLDAERRALDSDTAAAIAEDSARQARLDLLYASGRFP